MFVCAVSTGMGLPHGFGYDAIGLQQTVAGDVAYGINPNQYQQAGLTHGALATAAGGGQLYALQPVHQGSPGGVTYSVGLDNVAYNVSSSLGIGREAHHTVTDLVVVKRLGFGVCDCQTVSHELTAISLRCAQPSAVLVTTNMLVNPRIAMSAFLLEM